MNYWIFKVKDETGGIYGRKGIEIFMHRTKEGFWGIKEFDEKGKRENSVEQLKKGDYAVFYLVSKSGNRFIGTCILDSDYIQLDDEQAKQIVHREYIDSQQGVFIKEVDRWPKPLPSEVLRGKASFMRGSGKIGPFFQGSLKKIKNTKDYEAIISTHKQTR